MGDLVPWLCSSAQHWDWALCFVPHPLTEAPGQPCPWAGWVDGAHGVLLPWTIPQPSSWGPCEPWLVLAALCPALQPPLPSGTPARRLLAVWAPFPAESFPSLCSVSLLFPTMVAQAAWDGALNLNAASLSFTKIISPLQTQLCKK